MRFPLASLSLLAASLLSPVIAAAEVPSKADAPPKQVAVTYAHITISGSYPEGDQMPGLFGDVVEGLSDGIARLDRAAKDKAITGVILKVGSPGIGWGKLGEYRAAIARVRKAGKKVYAVSNSLGTMGYLIASSCDEVIMPESGVVMVLGLRAEVSFYKNLFDKIGVQPNMLRVGEYKAAAEPYSRTEMSPEFREEMEAILDSYYGQMVSTIGKGRKLNAAKIKAAIDSGPHSASAAKKLGLIDRLNYADDFEDALKKSHAGAQVKFVRRYGKKKIDTDFSGFAGMVKMMNLLMGVPPGSRTSRGPKIAVIHASGPIFTGKSQSDFFGGKTMGSATIIKAVKKAQADDNVKAIVLRIDSPGGSALASDLMWRALEKVDKPFVVSMGDTAASGGYYIAMGADVIFAEQGTLTGSIGVVGGKLAMKGLFEKLGITTSVVSRGKNSGAMSALDGFSKSERAAMTKLIMEIYTQFTRKAAKGRKMKYETLEKLARGRVYTGEMALKIGLVDKLGTLEDAVAHAHKLAGFAPGDKVERMILPKAPSPFEQLFGPIDASTSSKTAAGGLIMQELKSISPELADKFRMVKLINLLAKEARLTLMPFEVRVR
jgi:protease-4